MLEIPLNLSVPVQMIHRTKIPYQATYFEGTVREVSSQFGMQVYEDSGLDYPTPLSFEFRVGPLLCGLDYNDLPQLPARCGEYDLWFKFQSTSSHEPFGTVRPFPPCSFQDWNQYTTLCSEIQYRAKSDTVLYVTRPRLRLRAKQWAEDTTLRRTLVRNDLQTHLGDWVDMEFTDQLSYWRRAGECLVSVHVPGFWNNMLSRSQLQLMGFGVCTISPVLYTRLPDVGSPIPDVHYLACRDDYSDLLSKIEQCRDNPDLCQSIGSQAQKMFQNTCVPEKIWSYVGRETFQKSAIRI